MYILKIVFEIRVIKNLLTLAYNIAEMFMHSSVLV